MDLNQLRRESAMNAERLAIERQEARLRRAAVQARPAAWKEELENRIPDKVYTGLESAFCKGFGLVFDQGRVVIEKGYNKARLREDHAIRDYAVQVKGGRRQLRQLQKGARQSEFLNLAVTTVEGVGLGVLGIGMPDIVLFLATLLKGIYETALGYGFGYESRQEQLFILKMMAAALATGEDWVKANAEVEEMLRYETVDITQQQFDRQLQATSSAFAMDMLLLKFIQGLPVVGVLGGAANPVYYNKIMKYVQLKYRKRYFLKHQARGKLGKETPWN